MKGAISFKQVSKIFPPDTHAITDVNLDITEGEFMTVVGPSGCGKSTLLRMVAGLESRPVARLKSLGKMPKSSPQDRNLGMVFQNYALFPHLSVFDNIAYGESPSSIAPRNSPKSGTGRPKARNCRYSKEKTPSIERGSETKGGTRAITRP